MVFLDFASENIYLFEGMGDARWETEDGGREKEVRRPETIDRRIITLLFSKCFVA